MKRGRSDGGARTTRRRGAGDGTGGAGEGGDPRRGDGADADRESLPEPADDATPLTRLRRILAGIPRFGKLLYRLLGDPRVSLFDRALFGATLVYLFVPFDLVPDWLPAFGQLDDLVLVLFTLDRLLYRTDPGVLRDHWDGDPETLAALRRLLDGAADVLPGWARGLLRAG